jgi:hypothetical protein
MDFSSRKVFARMLGNMSHIPDGMLKKFSSYCLQMINIFAAGHGGIILFMLSDLQLNDHLRLRKPHPCGSYEWTVIRLGADIGLECKGCQHRVMLTRRELVKRMKANLTKHEENKEETK